MYMYVYCNTQSIMIQSKTNNTVIHIFEKESSSFLIEFHTTLSSNFFFKIYAILFFFLHINVMIKYKKIQVNVYFSYTIAAVNENPHV